MYDNLGPCTICILLANLKYDTFSRYDHVAKNRKYTSIDEIKKKKNCRVEVFKERKKKHTGCILQEKLYMKFDLR